MTQNIYDDEEFFQGYARLPRSIEGLEGMAEWPALRALLPELRGLNVLDLGCGYGWFCRFARQQGAAYVLGVDVSERMLARARASTQDDAIAYARADLEKLQLPGRPFDLAYSSLALHYIADLGGLMAKVRASLVPDGRLVFSVEHPIFSAPAQPGWSVTPAGRKTWRLDRYLDEGPRSTDWITKGVIKQHRTIASYLNLLVRLGFVIAHVEEWGPTQAQLVEHPEWAEERERPPFLLVAARRG